ncbi:MAG: T9SS type A sorting domain-containing protein [Ignavibacteria bacterium]|nr:T9SS type A sorting domain-containing protein [Ignavibacteria bacterium]
MNGTDSDIEATELSIPVHVRLEIYNVMGELITALVDEGRQTGYYSERFDATGLASGVYFYHMQAGDFVATKKLLLLK